MMNLRQKAKDLIALALDERTPDKERLTAAVNAIKLIQKHDLLSSPLDGILGGKLDWGIGEHRETIDAAKTIFERLTDPELVASFKKIAGKARGRRRRR